MADNKSKKNVLRRIDQFYTMRQYTRLMFERGVVSLSPAGFCLLEKNGVLNLDYVAVGPRDYIIDSPENQERMAEVQRRREQRLATPGWVDRVRKPPPP